MNLYEPSTIKELMFRHGFAPSKGLGQNFLSDRAALERIAEAAGLDEETGVLEVGPGVGALTVELAKRAGRVACVELDRKLLPVLGETLAGFANIDVVEGDILKTDIAGVCRRSFGWNAPAGESAPFRAKRVVACANLPYYITQPAINALLGSGCLNRITIMVQKEVADRICASPGAGDYGAFTLYVGYYARASRVLQVPRGSFFPPPKVDSTVIRLDLYENPPVGADQAALFRLIKAAFATRRKTLLNSLFPLFAQTMNKPSLGRALEQAGFDPMIRGERLGLEDFDKLTRILVY